MGKKRMFGIVWILFLILTVGVCCTGCGKKIVETQKKKSLVIGSDNYAPYNYLDKNGEFVGVDVELAREACSRIGYEAEFVQIEWEHKDQELADGTVDCLWGSFSMNDREDAYRWVGPYLYSRQMVAVRADSSIWKLSDLKEKTIAVQVSSKPENLFLTGKDSRIPQVRNVFTFSNMNEIYSSLQDGYVDAIAGHESALQQVVNEDPMAYRLLDESLFISELGVAFSVQETSDVVEKLQEALQEMYRDGTTRKIVEKYGLDAERALGTTY